MLDQIENLIKPILENSRASVRFNTCLSCPSFNYPTNQCKECGCLMFAKVLVPKAECPLDKWPKP